MADLHCNERNSHSHFPLRPMDLLLQLCLFNLYLTVSTITWPIVVGTTVSLAKVFASTTLIAPIHMIVNTSRFDHVAIVTGEPAVATVEAYRTLLTCQAVLYNRAHTWVRDFGALAGPFVESSRLSNGLSSGGSFAHNVLDCSLGHSLRESKGAPGDEKGGDESLDRKHDAAIVITSQGLI